MGKYINKSHVKYYGIIVLTLLFLAWCMTTISYKSGVFWIVGGILLILSEIVYTVTCTHIENKVFTDQLKNINRFLLMIGLIITGTCFRYASKTTIAASLFAGISMIITVVIAQKKMRERLFYTADEIAAVLNKIKNHEKLIMLLCALTVLSYEKQGLQFKWDGLLYYEAAHELNVFSISSLAEYGHLSQMYSLILKMMILIVGRVDIAMAVMNIAMMIASVCGFYELLTLILKGRSDSTYVIGTAIYGCSPFVLGMVNYYSLDYYLICLLPWCLYKGIKKQWVDFIVVSVLFCFTKETAIIIYAFLCLGFLILDFAYTKGLLIEKITAIVSHAYYYYMALIGVIWLIIYKMLGSWSAGSGGLSLNAQYAVNKMKVLGVLNFNWVLVLIIACGIICSLIRGTLKNSFFWSVPVGGIAIGFTLFSLLFVTANHARYIDSGVMVLYLSAVVILMSIDNKWLVNILTGCLAIVMLMECYFTIDPVSKAAFQTIEIGRSKMITTSNAGFGDSMIYNKQMLYMENAISDIVSDAYSKNYDIAMPVTLDSTYFFDGMQEVMTLTEGYAKRILYCNHDGGRSVYQSDDSKSVIFYSLTGNVDYEEVLGYSRKPIILIYTDMFGLDVYENIKKYCKVLDESTIYKKGYKIRTIVFE